MIKVDFEFETLIRLKVICIFSIKLSFINFLMYGLFRRWCHKSTEDIIFSFNEIMTNCSLNTKIGIPPPNQIVTH